MKSIGILAFQGDYSKHALMLKGLGVLPKLVRNPEDLEDADGIIIPGGESTTIGKLMTNFGVREPLRKRIESGMPVFGTCAGMILLSRGDQDKNQHRLSVLDISVERNAYGRQVDSFEADIDIRELGAVPYRGVFIRAPKVVGCGKNVEVLARFEDSPVFVKQDNILAASFHPELTRDTRIHRMFISLLNRGHL